MTDDEKYAGREKREWWWALESGAKRVTVYRTGTPGRWWCPGPDQFLTEGADLFHLKRVADFMVAELQKRAAEEKRRREEKREQFKREADTSQLLRTLREILAVIVEDSLAVPSTRKYVTWDSDAVPREQYCDRLLTKNTTMWTRGRQRDTSASAWPRENVQVENKKRSWRKVNWKQPTSVISRQLGEDPDDVARARSKYAPETVGKYYEGSKAMLKRYKGVNWAKSDWEIAEKLGKSVAAVGKLRVRLGIAPGPACCPTCKRLL